MKLKLKNEKDKDLAEKIAACFAGDNEVYEWEDLTVDIREEEDATHITVSRMYEYLPMHFGILKKFVELFGTEHINVNQWNYEGCETCDWGSKYAHDLVIYKNLSNRVGGGSVNGEGTTERRA